MRISFASRITVLSGLLLWGVLLVFSTFFVITRAGANTDDTARSGRLITIHDRGEEKVILTHARNVEDALKDADISVVEEDMVEPELKEELVATDYTVNIYRARPVIVVDGALREKIMTAAQTPESIAKAANLTMQDEDKATLEASDDIVADGAGVILNIDRATKFKLNLYGNETTAYTRAKTIKEMLGQKKIELASSDTLSTDINAPLVTGMTVSIWRNGVQTATIDEPIDFPVRKVNDVDKPAGFREVQTPGTKGKKSVTYEITMRNGKEISRKAIQSVVIEQPKEQVEVIGAKSGFSGNFAEALARLRSCEGSYTSNTGNGYYGAYQFDVQTWGGYGGYPHAAAAPPAVQDQKAWETYKRRGWQPWPSCTRSIGLQDIYR